MFCSTCGTPITPGLSFCNRCGASLKERSETNIRTGPIAAILVAVVLIATAGLGIMLGGAVSLKRDAALGEETVGMFMFFTFFIVALTEFFLVRQLSKLIGKSEPKRVSATPPAIPLPNELRGVPARSLAEPAASVTENTTRTLQYLRNQPPRQ